MECVNCPTLRVPRELLEFIAANARGVEREQMDKLRALLTAQPQASAAQSAPAGEREAAAYEHWKVDMEPYGFSGLDAFQARAAWQRTQSAGVPEGERLADLLESVWMGDDEAKPHGIGATYWNNAVIACKVAIRDALAAAPAKPAAQDQGEVQRLLSDTEALEGCREWMKTQELSINVGDVELEGHDSYIESSAGWLLRLLDAALAASTGQEVVNDKP